MKLKHRKLIAIFISVTLLILYALIAMVIGSAVIGHGFFLELLCFMILGLAWVPLVMPVIKWASPAKR